MQFHQLYDSYESYELTRARVDLDLTIMRCSFHHLHDLYDSYKLTDAVSPVVPLERVVRVDWGPLCVGVMQFHQVFLILFHRNVSHSPLERIVQMVTLISRLVRVAPLEF